MAAKVEFITKEGGCSLCDDMFVELESARDYVDFDLEIRKIEEDDELYRLYWDKIPVLENYSDYFRCFYS
jgi:hypothetical protein